MTQKLICMTEKEIARCNVIQNLIDGKIDGADASKQIGLSVRHIRRLKGMVIKFGARGIIHGNRGKNSNRKLSEDLIKKAEKCLKEKYYDFKPTFASEKLYEIEKIKLSKETVRIIMNKIGLWKIKPKKQSKKWHIWRARKDNYGEMQQFDGSYHIWFGNFETCLLLSVDDATGKITHAKFDYNEGIIPVFKFWTDYIQQHGTPISIYLDKFSTYKINHKNAVDNSEMITQFQRAMNQIGVKLITAHSPQAKGRVERMFNTLQDRLIKELRLAGITTIENANEFLKKYIPKFNAQFDVSPERRKNLHKKLDNQIKEKLPQIFSIQNERRIQNDYTIMFKNSFFQLDREQPTTVYKKDIIIVEEHLNNEIKLCLKNHYLNYTVLPERPKKQIKVKLVAITTKQSAGWKPPIDHPWRQAFILKRKRYQTSSQTQNEAVRGK